MPLPPALNLKGILDARLEYCRDCVYREFRNVEEFLYRSFFPAKISR